MNSLYGFQEKDILEEKDNNLEVNHKEVEAETKETTEEMKTIMIKEIISESIISVITSIEIGRVNRMVEILQ
jgi:hypothetical protein